MDNKRCFVCAFIGVQFLVLLIVNCEILPSFVSDGPRTALATLLGICLGVGNIHRALRTTGVLIAVSVYVFLVTALSFTSNMPYVFCIFTLHWSQLLWLTRGIAIGGLFGQEFLRRGYVLSTTGDPLTGTLLRFRIHHLLVLMALVAVYFTIRKNLDNSFSDSLLVLHIIMRGLVYSTLPLLVTCFAFEPDLRLRKSILYMFAILLLSFAITAYTYQVMGQNAVWPMVWYSWLRNFGEVIWLAGSLFVLRLAGFRIAKKLDVDDVQVASVAKGRLSLRVAMKYGKGLLFAFVIMLSMWVGWNASVVKEREQFVQSPNGGSIIRVVTCRENSDTATQEVKDRIAPLLTEANRIKRHGGIVVEPSELANYSLCRTWLGDEPIFLIVVEPFVARSQDLIQRLRDVFPEAMIVGLARTDEEMYPPAVQH